MTQFKGIFVGKGQILVGCMQHWVDAGHKLVSIISDCPEVGEWAAISNYPVVSAKGDLAGHLNGKVFDYLFSIVNHAILPDEVLTLPTRRAVNFHDSALPKYAGFNATSWAIMGGEAVHGVTWHSMTGNVDSGDILLQKTFEISSEDTGFSVGVKCASACRETFVELLAAFESEAESGVPISVTPQGPTDQFHLRSDRLGPGLIDFQHSASQIDRLVRGLDLGNEDNWMCRPKLLIGDKAFLVEQAELLVDANPGMPGQVMAVDADRIDIAASDGVVRFGRLATADGAHIDPVRLGMKVGDFVPSSAETSVALGALDARLTKHERFWVRRLSSQRGPALGQIYAHGGDAQVSFVRHERNYPAAAYIAALAASIARSGENEPFDLALAKSLPVEGAGIYASAAPMRISVDLDAPFATLLMAVERELSEQAKRGTYASDIVTRYSALRSAAPNASKLPIGLALGGEAGLVPGTAVTLFVDEASDEYVLSYDKNAMSQVAVEDISERMETLLADANERSGLPVAAINLLSEAKKRSLLELAQGPVKSYASDLCVHQHFEAQVRRTPDATALVFRNQKLTYRELDARANQIAHRLVARGVGPGDFVAVCLKRSTELVAALLGVMKAGGAYVPMDPVYPRDRLGIMFEDSNAKVLLTQTALAEALALEGADILTLESIDRDGPQTPAKSDVTADNLAYVIFTSGSTGRPKGVKVAHRNVSNFFAGMDDVIGTDPGVWLAVTSMSFDISVLEIFWTLSRGFEVIIQGESDRTSLAATDRVEVSSTPMDFGLFYFSASQGDTRPGETYKLLIEGAKFADANGFQSVWTPERHFHEFGGIYPNPAVTTAAIATITKNVDLRAGSVVLPLHNPVRVAEDWSVIDQLSNGRVGLSFASGWHANDFALMPQNYERRRELMVENIETVFKLWAGEEIDVENGEGQTIKVKSFPRPIQKRPPIWIASAGNIETFRAAGRLGANVLTNMLGQDIDDLRTKLSAYREARTQSGHEGPGHVSLMLHTFVCDDTEAAREIAREPFCNYLKSSFDLVKAAPWMFPAFKRPSLDGDDAQLDTTQFTDEDLAALLEYAFDRYFETGGLFGSPEHAIGMVEKLKLIGVNEIACLVDFGIDSGVVLENLAHLNRLRELANSASTTTQEEDDDHTISETLKAHAVTHLQCTPSMARMLIDDPDVLGHLGRLKHLMLGGEALAHDLADTLHKHLTGQFTNMYGPTETTIWSTTSAIRKGEPITIGRPIANTTIRLLDRNHQLVSQGAAGELCIGGDGVVPGYLGRDDLTAERFILDPFAPGERLYKTGDLARYTESGEIEFLGRLDQQVKINGYRIELGEIETQLSRHPDVWQSVVSTYTENGISQLVAYYSSSHGQSDSTEVVDQWKVLWDAAYKQREGDIDPRFNFSGWNDSYTGAPIPEEHMREWRDATQRNILDLNPRRVLEIGCGTGMVLFSVAPEVEHYTGTDISPSALEQIDSELTADEKQKVTLLQRPAHLIEDFEKGAFDTVIINSVAQYFPSAEYLTGVLRSASELVADGGQIFVGDVRSLDQLVAFHTMVELNQAPGHIEKLALNSRIDARTARDSELVLAEEYFQALVCDIPKLNGVSISLKRGLHTNEMTAFRYDVVLHVGQAQPATITLPAPKTAETLDEISSLLKTGEDMVYLRGIKNARLANVYKVREALSGAGDADANTLRSLIEAEAADGINPGALFDIHPDYRADVTYSGSEEPSTFDVVFRHKSRAPVGILPYPDRTSLKPANAYANSPAGQGKDQSQLIEELRTHLREHLPEYMIPSAFVALESFPLTPNGKIDRKALPAPKQVSLPVTTAYVPPTSALEETIADVWKEILNIPQVGRTDRIFDIGANSLLTAQANQRLSKKLGKRVSLVSMFRYPTVETLAAHLGAAFQVGSPATDEPEQRVNRREEAAARRRALREEKVN